MDMNEIYMLFKVIEGALAHGTAFPNIRDVAAARLKEIEAGLKPQPPIEEPVLEEGDA